MAGVLNENQLRTTVTAPGLLAEWAPPPLHFGGPPASYPIESDFTGAPGTFTPIPLPAGSRAIRLILGESVSIVIKAQAADGAGLAITPTTNPLGLDAWLSLGDDATLGFLNQGAAPVTLTAIVYAPGPGPGVLPPAPSALAHSQLFSFDRFTALRYPGAADAAGITPAAAPFAVGGWVQPSGLARIQYLWSKANGVAAFDSPGSLEWAVSINDLGQITGAVRTGGTTSACHSAADTWQANVWQHIYLTFTASAGTGTLTVYCNGVQVAQTPTVSTSIDLASLPFWIGNESANNWPFDGLIDDSGLWIGSTPSVTSLYNAGAGKSYRQLSASDRTGLAGYWGMNEAAGATAWLDQSGNGLSLTDDASGVGPAAPFVDPAGPA